MWMVDVVEGKATLGDCNPYDPKKKKIKFFKNQIGNKKRKKIYMDNGLRD